MGKLKKIALFFVGIFLIAAISFFYFRHQVYYSHGELEEKKIFSIEKGEGSEQIATHLEESGFISGKIYFYYYLKTSGTLGKIMPGDYLLAQNLTIPEIVHIITSPEEKFVKVTFPEGFTSEQMSERLESNGLPGKEFLQITKNPLELKKRYSYLSDSDVTTLEGYLFPDTYFFKKDISAQNIVGRMLDRFDEKLTEEMKKEAISQGKEISDIVKMASIIEEEVKKTNDRKIVSGIFWNRISSGMPLQSDATLTYILGDKKDSHSLEETRIDSPYNSYIQKGLPPTPIDNPGSDSILAAIYPQKSDYLFFVSTPSCGPLFAKTLEEHGMNRTKCNL